MNKKLSNSLHDLLAFFLHAFESVQPSACRQILSTKSWWLHCFFISSWTSVPWVFQCGLFLQPPILEPQRFHHNNAMLPSATKWLLFLYCDVSLRFAHQVETHFPFSCLFASPVMFKGFLVWVWLAPGKPMTLPVAYMFL